MTKSYYPDPIYYYDQLMTSRISLKEAYKIERKAMRILGHFHKENSYIALDEQAPFILQFSEALQLFVDNYEKFLCGESLCGESLCGESLCGESLCGESLCGESLNGEPLNGESLNGESLNGVPLNNELLNGEFIFILTCETKPKILYSKTEKHSYLANGKKVLAAGSLEFMDGKLIAISNNSGHYRPTNDEMLPAIKALHKLSNGTLARYTSYSTEGESEYAVDELLKINTFDSVDLFPIDETLSANFASTELLGYDGVVNVNQDHRFNCTLSESLKLKYTQIIDYGYSIFSPIQRPAEEKIEIKELCAF